jgi:L-methionine (R)-S-oxide reductase
VPLMSGGSLLGVLDVDAPKVGRFDEEDRRGLEAVGRIVSRRIGVAA